MDHLKESSGSLASHKHTCYSVSWSVHFAIDLISVHLFMIFIFDALECICGHTTIS